ncbi:Growth/differentiation factor 9 [Dissostichus eleginoides]|uniref:Growth/differentiation factor 9 n=1 Tax=Dissostichus eleginoides TaxID=100907 RepID=A0AAD9AZS5_DISEL|nr:Growth/differentiation factor 9 [Dissostichus eleginoides]
MLQDGHHETVSGHEQGSLWVPQSPFKIKVRLTGRRPGEGSGEEGSGEEGSGEEGRERKSQERKGQERKGQERKRQTAP